MILPFLSSHPIFPRKTTVRDSVGYDLSRSLKKDACRNSKIFAILEIGPGEKIQRLWLSMEELFHCQGRSRSYLHKTILRLRLWLPIGNN